MLSMCFTWCICTTNKQKQEVTSLCPCVVPETGLLATVGTAVGITMVAFRQHFQLVSQSMFKLKLVSCPNNFNINTQNRASNIDLESYYSFVQIPTG